MMRSEHVRSEARVWRGHSFFPAHPLAFINLSFVLSDFCVTVKLISWWIVKNAPPSPKQTHFRRSTFENWGKKASGQGLYCSTR